MNGDDPRLGLGRSRDLRPRLPRLGQQRRNCRADRSLVGAKTHEHVQRDPLAVVHETEETCPGVMSGCPSPNASRNANSSTFFAPGVKVSNSPSVDHPAAQSLTPAHVLDRP